MSFQTFNAGLFISIYIVARSQVVSILSCVDARGRLSGWCLSCIRSAIRCRVLGMVERQSGCEENADHLMSTDRRTKIVGFNVQKLRVKRISLV